MNTSITHSIKRGTLLAGMLVSSLFVASCATAPAPPEGAEQVRSKLTSLKQDPHLADRARVEVREAEAAVKIAEQPLSEEDSELGKHRVYMADRAVEIAEARAATQYAEAQRERLAEEREEARLQARTREADRARSAADAAQSSQTEMAAAAARQEEEYQRRIEELEAEVTDRGVVLTLGDVLFATGSAELQGGAGGNLNKLVGFLKEYPDRKVQIEGHTDNVGSAEFNQGLSQRRADSVKNYLTQQGIDSQRLSTSGIGMGQPIASNDTAAGRQQNRRVEIIVEDP